MTTKMAAICAAVLMVAALSYSLVLYPTLPERIPTHWNIAGKVDGWGSKDMGAFMMPGVMALFLVLIYALPWLSPKNFKIENFRATFNYIMVIVAALMGFMHWIMLYAGMHAGVDVGRAMIVGMCAFFALLGNVLGKVKRNFWMGVRTPWTLASDTVWVATHRLAGRLAVAGSLLAAIIVLLGGPVALAFAVIMAWALIPVVYSLVLYKRLEREGAA
jgi:uncharacterized membrane protein